MSDPGRFLKFRNAMLQIMDYDCTCESDPLAPCAVHRLRGAKVIVYPHGHADQAAIGTVVLISRNERSIAVGFEECPPFARAADGIAIHPEHGVVLLATREAAGPWIELFDGGHYEIEPTDS